MESPTVIIDLSPVVRLDGKNDWHHVDLVVREWRAQQAPQAVFFGVADNSLWHVMKDDGKNRLRQWQRERRARSVSWADPEILALAEQYPDAVVITTDLYRDHRRDYPWLQGSQRFFAPAITGDTVTFTRLDFSPIPAHEVSLRHEEAGLKPKGITSREAQRALDYEWSCTEPGCHWEPAAVIGEDPSFRDGRARCPECGEAAQRVGLREHTREVVVEVGGHITDRIPIAEATTLTFGRRRGYDRYDLRDLLDERHANLVSRDHLRLSNDRGRLVAEELGSKNGTKLIRSTGTTDLMREVRQVLELNDRLGLARGAVQIRPSGRRRPRGRYHPDLTTPPWFTEKANESN